MNNLSHFWEDFTSGLPDVVVALLVLVLGLVVAWIAKALVLKFIKITGIKRGMAKAGIEQKNIESATSFFGRLVYLVVFILFLPGIFEKLGLNNVATPIVAMMNGFMTYLPNIIGAIIIAMVGLFVAKLAKELLTPILKKTKLNAFVEKAGVNSEKIDVTSIIVNIIYTVVAVFFVVEALNTLKLDVLTHIGNQIIAYLPYALSAAIVMLVAFLLGNWVENILAKNFGTSRATALVAKIAIIVIGVFMSLYQLGIASEMVNAAFIIVLGAFGVAFAVAFGIGGREFAAHTMKKFEQKLDENSRNRKR